MKYNANELIAAARESAEFGYRAGYKTASDGIKNFIKKADDAELAKIAPEAKKYARIIARALDDLAEQKVEEFLKRVRCYVVEKNGSIDIQ